VDTLNVKPSKLNGDFIKLLSLTETLLNCNKKDALYTVYKCSCNCGKIYIGFTSDFNKRKTSHSHDFADDNNFAQHKKTSKLGM